MPRLTATPDVANATENQSPISVLWRITSSSQPRMSPRAPMKIRAVVWPSIASTSALGSPSSSARATACSAHPIPMSAPPDRAHFRAAIPSSRAARIRWSRVGSGGPARIRRPASTAATMRASFSGDGTRAIQ